MGWMISNASLFDRLTKRGRARVWGRKKKIEEGHFTFQVTLHYGVHAVHIKKQVAKTRQKPAY